IKRALGYDHFLLKGLEKVRTEWSLITLAYNLKRVLNLVSLPKLLAAVFDSGEWLPTNEVLARCC
ncbi:MAG TPA: transposase, partial [Candidatus Binatia bacterium]|nr:transposase [Candidatus Binatia bacterium]